MKKLAIATSIALATTGATQAASAAEGKTQRKQEAVVLTSAFVGAIAGGPVGFILGALGGGYMAGEIEQADKAELTELELAEKNMQLAQLQTQLAKADTKVGELTQLALDKLEFQVMFHTGADRLTERGEARVQALAQFLKQHPGLSVRLTGHADPRGTDEYNNVLSDQRALTVQATLEAQGVDSYRIERRAFGADKSEAIKGDYEAYAMDRRVDIEIYNPMIVSSLVQAH
jgi:outer membrane protein OmpA-like peptidoglycan-associated protein